MKFEPGDIVQLHYTYKIESFLYEGGFADLYLATQKRYRRRVVIKVFKNQSYEGIESPEYYWRREKAFISIQSNYSEYALKLIDYYIDMSNPDEPVYFLVTKFINGKSFHDWYTDFVKLNPNINSPEFARILIEQIFLPLADYYCYIHELGLIHRDLSTTNIIIIEPSGSYYPIPVVIDFGGGRNFDPGTLLHEPSLMRYTHQRGTIFYTPGFTSPEINAGKRPVPQTDIYNFGVVLFFAFTNGQFRAKDLTKEDYVLNPTSCVEGISEQICAIIEKCTQYEPNERFRSFFHLKKALEAFIEADNDEKAKKKANKKKKGKKGTIICKMKKTTPILNINFPLPSEMSPYYKPKTRKILKPIVPDPEENIEDYPD